MGFFDSLLGKSKQVNAQLDSLFALSGAAITLEVNADLEPVLTAGVVFKPASGAAFSATEEEFKATLAQMAGDGTTLEMSTDSYGYRWVVIHADDIESLVTGAHVVNRSLEDHGFSPQLLCSVFPFTDRATGDRVYWIYLYKRGTFYPFVPTGKEDRNNEKELSLKAVIGTDLPVEADLSRWFAIWGIPF